MRFTQSFTALFATGLLATSVIAGVINPVTKNDLANWAKKTCSPKKKRSIVARADVGLNDAEGAGPTEALTTDALSTCMGLVVTGTRKQGQTPNNHFMAHVVMDGTETAINKLKRLVNNAKPELNDLKSYYTQAGLTQANTKAVMQEESANVSDEDASDFMNYLNELYGEVIGELQALAPVAGHTTHDP